MAASPRLPTQRVEEGQALAHQRAHVQRVGADIEHRVALAKAEVVNRAGIIKPQPLAINQSAFLVETIKIQIWLGGGKCDAEVEHLAGRAVELRVRGERADGIQPPAEIELPERFKRPRIELNR